MSSQVEPARRLAARAVPDWQLRRQRSPSEPAKPHTLEDLELVYRHEPPRDRREHIDDAWTVALLTLGLTVMIGLTNGWTLG